MKKSFPYTYYWKCENRWFLCKFRFSKRIKNCEEDGNGHPKKRFGSRS